MSTARTIGMLAVAAALMLGGCGDEANPDRSASPPLRERPASSLLSRPPYLGVACPVPNSIACDRVGLAVWLRRPARRVVATIGRQRFALDDERWRHDTRGDAHIGYLQPAGLLGDGPLAVRADEPPHRLVRGGVVRPFITLRITRASGPPVVTRTRAGLHPGWG